ncbi:ABC transporter permease [Nitrospirillum iridis]|uniref:Simple sugar transport system permease protein n=1 Tax=Nitrospirillum iridis TaxID=765888 RepID=A0A7X0B3X2_9PROT|nr:ABC transporter permease [Nitrospirillum iridis]MBB6255273.1 simple sugar transport system permease protein [Nitrospirillum iridis]
MSVSTNTDGLPRWATLALLPAINLGAALVVSSLVILAIGQDPVSALAFMVKGAVGTGTGLSYTLYYATSLIFTGLAVAVANHTGLFNIGGEGQAYIGGLGTGLVCLALTGWPWYAVLPVAVLAGALFGAVWGLIPGYLQAYRGSHIVITTIMFNFLASALMVYLLGGPLLEHGQMAPESREFAESTFLPGVKEIAAALGYRTSTLPLNLSLVVALLCAVGVWFFIWHTRWGFQMRTVGANDAAARYAGINARTTIVVAMALSGALAGLVGINELQGVQHRVTLNFQAGMGFTGIAVALMGRGHPVGIVLSSLLFGALYQGGAELSFEYNEISPRLVVVIQGVVILFSGALEHMFRPALVRLLKPKAPAGAGQRA